VGTRPRAASEPIGSITAALGADAVPYATRYTSVTSVAIAGVDPYEICRFAGLTTEVFEEVYAHHHQPTTCAASIGNIRRTGTASGTETPQPNENKRCQT
jgi:hypothetical protein